MDDISLVTRGFSYCGEEYWGWRDNSGRTPNSPASTSRMPSTVNTMTYQGGPDLGC